jgi:hypothetical protein
VYKRTIPQDELRSWIESLGPDISIRNRIVPEGVEVKPHARTPVTAERKSTGKQRGGGHSKPGGSADSKQEKKKRKTVRQDATYRAKEGGGLRFATVCLTTLPSHVRVPLDEDVAVVLYLRCAGKSNHCRLFCQQKVPPCWQGRGKGKATKGKIMPCACGESGEDEHWLLCKCQPGVVQTDSHFLCRYAFQVRIPGPDFTTAEIWEGDENSVAHQSAVGEPLKQDRYKIPESVKDDLDLSRIQERSTPRQWLACKAAVALAPMFLMPNLVSFSSLQHCPRVRLRFVGC